MRITQATPEAQPAPAVEPARLHLYVDGARARPGAETQPILAVLAALLHRENGSQSITTPVGIVTIKAENG
jgi:hypothetical protein